MENGNSDARKLIAIGMWIATRGAAVAVGMMLFKIAGLAVRLA
jgi:hypothetical protein